MTTTTSENHIPDSNDKSDDENSEQNGASQSPERGFDKRSTWLRLLFMLLVVFLYGVSRVVTAAVVILQVFWVLFTAAPNARLTEFGQSLATYTYQILLFLTYNIEEKPFPFSSEWPSGPPQ